MNDLIEESTDTIRSLKVWVCRELSRIFALPVVDVTQIEWKPINGDAGFRQYYRVSSDLFDRSLLAVYAPPATENNSAFVNIARFLGDGGVRVPKVHSYDLAHGWLLIEDLGNNLLHESLTSDSVSGLYAQVLNALLHMQTLPTNRLFPAYDGEKLNEEMQFFPKWFVRNLLSYTLSDEELERLNDSFTLLTEQALVQPQVIVHRDFHSRNILLDDAQSPAFIDFQDAVVGPVTYDLVSLLKDCYIRWPKEQVDRWALAYGNLLLGADLISPIGEAEFLKWFHWMGLQRHIKVMGIFARLYLRDNKPGYLKDLPLVIQYSREVMSAYPELANLSDWFESTIMPLVKAQKWMNACE